MSVKDRHLTEVTKTQGRSVLRAVCRDSGVSASLSPADGAELCSLTIDDASGNHELLYRGNDWTPVTGWPGRAPWLWPTAGRTYSAVGETGQALPQSVYSWERGGRVRPMALHGFARSRPWMASSILCDSGSATVSARLESGPEDSDSFPYDYHLETSACVSGSTVTLSMNVTAASSNNEPMPFTIGQHLTFNLSSWWGADWLKGSLHGAGTLGWSVDRLKLADEPVRFPEDRIPLAHPHLDDLLLPAVLNKSVELVSPDKQKALALSFHASSLPSSDAALWVVHRDTQGRYFCLEPWVGWPNGLSSGRGRVLVDPGDTWRMSLRMDLITAAPQDEKGTAPKRVVHINPAVVDSVLQRRPVATTKNERMTEDL